MPNLLSIQHPRFTRRNKNEYTIQNPDGRAPWHVHVGQIMTYLAFDAKLRKGTEIRNTVGIPLGYGDFVTAFNSGTNSEDSRRLSEYVAGTTSDYISQSTTPVYLQDFHITPDQCGITPVRQSGITEAQALIFEDYATTQAYKNKKKRENFHNREQKRNAIFEKPPKKSRKRYFESENNHTEIANPIITTFSTPTMESTENYPSTSQTIHNSTAPNEETELIEETESTEPIDGFDPDAMAN